MLYPILQLVSTIPYCFALFDVAYWGVNGGVYKEGMNQGTGCQIRVKIKKQDFSIWSKVIGQTKLDYEDACVTTQNPKTRVPVHAVPLWTPLGPESLPAWSTNFLWGKIVSSMSIYKLPILVFRDLQDSFQTWNATPYTAAGIDYTLLLYPIWYKLLKGKWRGIKGSYGPCLQYPFC